MSPRRHQRRDRRGSPPHSRRDAPYAAVQRVDSGPRGEWLVRSVPGGAAAKTYRCPGCDQEIPAGAPHLVTWPLEGPGGLSDRRHWHAPCWAARERRAPRTQRTRDAPRY